MGLLRAGLAELRGVLGPRQQEVQGETGLKAGVTGCLWASNSGSATY